MDWIAFACIVGAWAAVGWSYKRGYDNGYHDAQADIAMEQADAFKNVTVTLVDEPRR